MDALAKICIELDPQSEFVVDREIIRELVDGPGTVEGVAEKVRCDANTVRRRMGTILIRELLKKREELKAES
jgi:hypothetical protein